MSAAADLPRGCYGLRIDDLAGAARFLTSVPEDAPQLRLRKRIGPGPLQAFELNSERAAMQLSDGRSQVLLDRRTAVADVWLAEDYADEALLHPLLSGSLAVLNWWSGRDALHAGAFVHNGRAWAVIGDKGMGKSSLMGYLGVHDVPVLTDDVVVIDQGDIVAGPAFVDLRPDAAAFLGQGRDMGVLGARPRFRLDLAPPPPRVPLAGWITLAWSETPELRRLPVAQTLALLFDNRAVLLQPAAPSAFAGFAALPFFELRRPKRWDALSTVRDLLAGLPG